MKALFTKKGLTLIEIIISLAILGIILVSFLNIFTNSYTTIFSMGHKTQAMAEAQEIVDAVYLSGNPTVANIESIIGAKGFTFESKSNFNDLINHSYNNINVRYCIETQSVLGVNNNKVSILIFYQNGKRFVTLTSIIP